MDEPCDGLPSDKASPHDLPDEHVWYLPTYTRTGHEITAQRRYVCSGCLRALLQRYYATCGDAVLMDTPIEAYAAERCEACGLYRCGCDL